MYIQPPFELLVEHKQLFVEFLKQNDDHEMYISGEGGCVDRDTEYLTKSGWVSIDKYVGEDIAVVHRVGSQNKVNFEQPTDYIVNTGKFTAYKFYDINRRSTINMVLTPDHRVPYYTSKWNLNVKTTQELVDEMYEKEARGNVRSKFYAGGMGVPTGFTYCTDNKLLLTNDELSYMLAVQADGTILIDKGAVQFNFKKDRKIERLTSLLDKLGYYYTVHTYDTGYTRFYVKGKHILQIKDLTSLYNASLEQMYHIAEEVRHWDGSVDKRTSNTQYSSNDKANVDVIQFILTATTNKMSSISIDDRHKRGSKSAVTEGYTVSNTTQNSKTLELSYLSEVEIDNSYCFTTSSSYWLARRGDFIFVTGNSGKTTLIIHFILYMVERKIPFLLGAYTHAACKILREKVYKDPTSDEAMTSIRTIHSFLQKSPGVNVNSLDIRRVSVTNRRGKPEAPRVLLFDEYSMIGEEDYMDIGDLCMDEETGEILVKTIYVGDIMQLAPVKSARTVYPRGHYQLELLVNHRAGTSCLIEVLTALRKMKENKAITKLPDCDAVHRKVDLLNMYKPYVHKFHKNKILCYTNFAVDVFNAHVYSMLTNNDNSELHDKDVIFVDTHKYYQEYKPVDTFELRGDNDIKVKTNGKQVLTTSNDTYRTIPFLLDNFDFMEVRIPNEGTFVKAYIFGNVNYMNTDRLFKQNAVASNQKLAIEFNVDANVKGALKKIKADNPGHELVIASKQAWRLYLSFQNNVTMVSRPYASTIHKVQGLTLENVFISNKDLLKLFDRDKWEYLSLFYTAMSRARNEVYIDN